MSGSRIGGDGVGRNETGGDAAGGGAAGPGAGSGSRIVIRPHQVGDLGYIAHRHAVLYNREFGFDIGFEAAVARIAADFIETFDAETCCARIAVMNEVVVGSAFVVPGEAGEAKLRLVFLEPEMRGQGLGRRLVGACIAFAQAAGYRRMTLGTHDILLPARALYASLGFKLVAAVPFHGYGLEMLDETWAMELTG